MTSLSTDLPFFSYGIFKPGQLGYFRIMNHIDRVEEAKINGGLWIRDGIPLLDTLEPDHVEGHLIWFVPDQVDAAIEKIEEVEPASQYSEEISQVETNSGEVHEANVLVGKSLTQGGNRLSDAHGEILNSWDGRRDDPLFNEALEVVEETLEIHGEFEPGNVNALLHLQMAYIMLWISLERYASLRYGFTLSPGEKIQKIAAEESFRKGLKNVVSLDTRPARTEVYRTDDPNVKLELDIEDPNKSLRYYYQVRSNIVHRGKGAFDSDFRLMSTCLQELFEIFESYMIPTAFSNA